MQIREKTETHLGIKMLAEEDRPREKMLLKGRSALSDAELLAILIGSGTVGESAVLLAQKILKDAGNNLHELGKQSLKELQKHKGIGEAKAITIAAALELGRRRQASDVPEKVKITASNDAYRVIAPFLYDLRHEEFWLIYLNRANMVIGKEQISSGGATGTVADLKLIFKKVIEANAVGFIAVHNHPSGQLTPSEPDKNLTKKMVESGKLLDLPLLDHLIISEKGYYSFGDQGLING
jgi:DNA repair protein RadC